MLREMVLRTLILVAAVLGVLAPNVADAEDAPSEALRVVTQVKALKDAREYASAARLAAEQAAREDLPAGQRAMFGGLARQSFELSYEAGGDVADLCGLAAVMRLVAPLGTAENGELMLAEALKAEAKLEQVKGPGWRAVCEPPTPAPTIDASQTAARDVTAVAPAPAPSVSVKLDTRHDSARPVDRRRVRDGLATLIPGLLLSAPMAAVLVHRRNGERELGPLLTVALERPLTQPEREEVDSLNHRYRATTAGAAVLGAAGVALAATGVALLATSRRTPVTVAPWGARGAGGLVLGGRF